MACSESTTSSRRFTESAVSRARAIHDAESENGAEIEIESGQDAIVRARFFYDQRVAGALHCELADVNRIMAVPAQEFDGLGRDPRVREEPHHFPAGIG